MKLRRSLLLGMLLSLGACGDRMAPRIATATTGDVAHPSGSAASPKGSGVPDVDALFPSPKTGWEATSEDERARIQDFAGDYMEFLSTARTQRQTAAALIALAKSRGATPFDKRGKHKAGSLLYWQDRSGSTAALLKVGTLPVEEGLRLIIAFTDGGVIRLTPSPSYEKSGLALFDTTILGRLKLESWLNVPLLLNVHIAAKKGGEAKTITIGDDPAEPVFTIPDLLPHLSRKVQRNGLVDSAERLDALAAFSLKSLAKGLKAYGLSTSDWNRAEAQLLPAQGASYIGVDRALIASPNHAARAFPFAATRALLENESKHTSLVILMGHSKSSHAGADAEAHVLNLLPLAIAQQRSKLDALDLRRIYARSQVLLFDNQRGERNQGVALNSRKDDATPEAFRQVLQSFESTKTQLQIVEGSGWSDAREVASLDMNAVEVGLPIAGEGTPSAMLSTLDLYQALLACQGWVTQ